MAIAAVGGDESFVDTAVSCLVGAGDDGASGLGSVAVVVVVQWYVVDY